MYTLCTQNENTTSTFLEVSTSGQMPGWGSGIRSRLRSVLRSGLWLRVKGLRLDLSWVLLVFIFLYILQLHFFFLYLQHKDMFCHTQKCKFIWINPQLPCVWSDKNIELFDCPYIYCLCILGRNNRQYDLCFLCSSNYWQDRLFFCLTMFSDSRFSLVNRIRPERTVVFLLIIIFGTMCQMCDVSHPVSRLMLMWTWSKLWLCDTFSSEHQLYKCEEIFHSLKYSTVLFPSINTSILSRLLF